MPSNMARDCWAIFRKTEDVEVYIGVVAAKDEQDALAKAALLHPRKIAARLSRSLTGTRAHEKPLRQELT